MKRILFVASEANPFAGTGGLGDVIGSLPSALAQLDPSLDVRVILPLYDVIKNEYRDQMKKEEPFCVKLSWREQYCGLYSLKYRGVTFYFVDNEYYFKRGALYGNYDDGERYAFFCKAVMESAVRLDFIPDVLHCNDWQSALCVIYQKHVYRFENTKTVYTIHNIEYQGVYDQAILGDVFDLPESSRNDVVYDGCINLTKGAMICANAVTTVSSRYAQEISTPAFACGLHHAVALCQDKLYGIVNGIDYAVYDPKKDKDVPANFSKTNPVNKGVCKAALQKAFSLPSRQDVPLVAMVSRLAAHKGFDLVRQSLEELLCTEELQFVLLGTGEGELESYFEAMARKYPNKCGVILAYNKALSKLVYAGADLFLMPSKSEPCGLAQMMACRYGAVPVVHAVGGLYDTIVSYDEKTGKGNGVTFAQYDAAQMKNALRRALKLYSDPKTRTKLRYNAMSSDFSWKRSASTYLELYRSL